MSALARSRRLARIDVVSAVRKHTNWESGPGVVVAAAVYAVGMVASTLGGGYVAYRGGRRLVDAPRDPATIFEVARGLLAFLAVVLAVVFLVRAVGQRGTLAHPAGVLTVVSTRDALLGVVLAEYAYYLLWLLPPATGVGVGLAVGTGAVWPALTVPLTGALVGATCVSLGYALGLSVRHVATRFPFVVRHKGAIILVVFVAYVLLLATGAWTNFVVRYFEPVANSPLGWYADAALLGTPGLDAVAARAVGAAALSVGAVAVGVAGGTFVAARHWFSDPALAGEQTATHDEGPGVEARLAPALGVQTAALVALSWRRARRTPLKLLYAFYPVLLLVGLFADVVQSGQVPAYLPPVVLLLAAWAAGVVFTLNPLGDQGAALATTLVSDVDGHTFVRATLVASLVVAVPVGVVATAVAAALSPLDGGTALLVVAAAPVVMVVSAALSVGVGAMLPRFEATAVTRSMETVLPSPWAFVLFTLHLLATALAAAAVYEPLVREVGAGLLTWALPGSLSVSTGGLYWGSVLALVPLLAAPVLAYRYAVGRFDRYTLN